MGKIGERTKVWPKRDLCEDYEIGEDFIRELV